MSTGPVCPRSLKILPFAIGLLCGTALTWYCLRVEAPAAKPLELGTEVFGFLPEQIMLVRYETATSSLTAQRMRAGDPFAVQTVYSDGRPHQQCMARQDLNGLLPRLATLAIKQPVKAERLVQEFPVQLGTLGIRDTLATEPMSAVSLRATRDGKAVAAVQGGLAFEAGLPGQVLTTLQAGCSALGHASAP